MPINRAALIGLDGGELIRDGTIDVGDVPDGTLTLAKLSSATIPKSRVSCVAASNVSGQMTLAQLQTKYVVQELPFMFSGSTSGDAVFQNVGYLRYDSYPVGVAFDITGTAAPPTTKVKIDVHYRKSSASAVASTNSFFRTGAKATQAATLLTMGFTAASTATTLLPSGCTVLVQKVTQGSATGTTRIRGVVLVKVPLQA